MNKTVIVFSGVVGWQNFNATPVPFPNVDCPNCLVHAAAYQTYLEAKALTADFADVKTVQGYNGHIWSITGHGFGGMVAQIAAVDLGYRGLASAVHSFGAARVFNSYSAALYNKLFEGESGSRTVANNDAVPTWIGKVDDYTFVEQGFHIFGTNSTFGQNYYECGFNIDDPNCLGGDNEADHEFYYTPIGTCGQNYSQSQYNPSADTSLLQSQESAYSLTNTVPLATAVSVPSVSVPAPSQPLVSGNGGSGSGSGSGGGNGNGDGGDQKSRGEKLGVGIGMLGGAMGLMFTMMLGLMN